MIRRSRTPDPQVTRAGCERARPRRPRAHAGPGDAAAPRAAGHRRRRRGGGHAGVARPAGGRRQEAAQAHLRHRGGRARLAVLHPGHRGLLPDVLSGRLEVLGRAAGLERLPERHRLLQPLRSPEVAGAAGRELRPRPRRRALLPGEPEVRQQVLRRGRRLRRPGPRVLLRATRVRVSRRRDRLVLQARRRLLRRSLLCARPALLPGALPQPLPAGHAALRPQLLRQVPDLLRRDVLHQEPEVLLRRPLLREDQDLLRPGMLQPRSEVLRQPLLRGNRAAAAATGCCPANQTCVTTAGQKTCCPNAQVARVGGTAVCCPAGDVAVGDRCCPAANPSCRTCDPPCPAGHVCRDGFCLQV